MKVFTDFWPGARANGHLAEAHAKAGNIEAAQEYATQAARLGYQFISGRDAYRKRKLQGAQTARLRIAVKEWNDFAKACGEAK